MSEFNEYEDFDVQDIDGSMLSEEELAFIQDEYRKQKMKENLIGPSISTAVHVALVAFLVFFAVGEIQKASPSVEIVKDTPEVQPPPPPPPPVVKPPDQPILTTDPTVTSISTPEAADILGAFEDSNDEPPSTEDFAEADLLNELKDNNALTVSNKFFGGRRKNGRLGAIKQYSAQTGAQLKLDKALLWLKKVQKPDGSWGTKNIDGMTGLALLVFLAHGETPKSRSFGLTVSKAIKYLAASPVNKKAAHGYPHAIKTYALAEAYTMTNNYNLEEPLQRFAEVIIKGQRKDGAFEYNYGKSGRWDISIGGWNFQALKALKVTGLEFEGLDNAVYKAIERLKAQAPEQYPYAQGSKRTNDGLRAVGTLSLQLFGEARGFAPTDKIMEKLKTDAVPKLNWEKPPR